MINTPLTSGGTQKRAYAKAAFFRTTIISKHTELWFHSTILLLCTQHIAQWVFTVTTEYAETTPKQGPISDHYYPWTQILVQYHDCRWTSSISLCPAKLQWICGITKPWKAAKLQSSLIKNKVQPFPNWGFSLSYFPQIQHEGSS